MHEIVLNRCAYLGGCNYPIAAGDVATLRFGSKELLIRLFNEVSFSLPYLELASIEVSGPGTITSGGGFIGGGFGVEDALEGMAIAAVLNALTTKSKIHTFLNFITNIGELHFHYGEMEPGALRVALAPVHTTLRMLNPRWRKERIEAMQLAQAQGTISETEFADLQRRLSTPTIEIGVPPPATSKKEASPQVAGPKGRCPNCGATVALQADECYSCKALFGPDSAWKVVPFL